MSLRRAFLKLDFFREVHPDLTAPSYVGSLCSLLAVFACGALFTFELQSYLNPRTESFVVLDANQDKDLQINFDLEFPDMSCKNLELGVSDSLGTDRMNVTGTNIRRQKIDHLGSYHQYSEGELVRLETKKLSQEEQELLDSDWTDKSIERDEKSFQEMIEAHDFVAVNFYVTWCPHCKDYLPEWDRFEEQLNSDGNHTIDGKRVNLRVLKIDCGIFTARCQEQKVKHFPSVRLYRRRINGEFTYESYTGKRKSNDTLDWVREKITDIADDIADESVKKHDFFSEGCRVDGSVQVARVPGTLHFEAANTAHETLNLAYTNVSHIVHHFSFSTADDLMNLGLVQAVNGAAATKNTPFLPRPILTSTGEIEEINPTPKSLLKPFVSDNLHEYLHHYVQVVSTYHVDQKSRSYQLTHQSRVARAKSRKDIPQAKFSYGLSPMEVRIQGGGKPLYNFLVSTMALVGGAFTTLALLQNGASSAKRLFVKEQLGKTW